MIQWAYNYNKFNTVRYIWYETNNEIIFNPISYSLT